MQDQVIERFEARFGEAQAETRHLAASLAEARRRAEAAESRAAEALEQRAKARKAHERQLAQASDLQASLRAEASALKVHRVGHSYSLHKCMHASFQGKTSPCMA